MKIKIETVSEQRERMLREQSVMRIPGRALPTNCQWTGQDQPGGQAAARRLRQAAKQLRWKAVLDTETCDACALRDGKKGLPAPPHPDCGNPNGCRCTQNP